MTMGSRRRAAHSGNPDARQHELLFKYRIGERLRPGCKNCGYEPTVKLWMLRRGLWCYGSLGVRDISRICHGNGIVPARKARKARG
jgi:hypothetical protein